MNGDDGNDNIDGDLMNGDDGNDLMDGGADDYTMNGGDGATS